MYNKTCIIKKPFYLCSIKNIIMDNSNLKIRVLNAKRELPKSGVTSLFFHYFKSEFPETCKNKSKLNNVLQTRTTDEDITEKLESLVSLLINNKNKF